MRAFCTACTTSRASPSRRSSSSRVQVERHRVRARSLHLVALERLEHHLDVVGPERVVRAVDRHVHLAALAQRRAARAASSAGHRGGHLGHVLAEARPERAVVGLELEAAELVGL